MSEKTSLYCTTVTVKKLNLDDITQMFQLFEKYYEEISIETFQRDLAKKDKIVLMRETATKKVVGFSTIKFIKLDIPGQKQKAYGLFSGDTIVAKKYWGQKVLHNEFARVLLQEKLKRPFSDFYWFLISKGYKTYLALSNNFPEFYPRYDQATPPDRQAVIDSYARTLFGSDYYKRAGLLKFKKSLGQLKGDVAPISEDLIRRVPHVAFFQKKNPNWINGDELVCLGVVTWSVFTNHSLKILNIGLRKLIKPELIQKQAES